jgi:hypothetical protein
MREVMIKKNVVHRKKILYLKQQNGVVSCLYGMANLQQPES